MKPYISVVLAFFYHRCSDISHDVMESQLILYNEMIVFASKGDTINFRKILIITCRLSQVVR